MAVRIVYVVNTIHMSFITIMLSEWDLSVFVIFGEKKILDPEICIINGLVELWVPHAEYVLRLFFGGKAYTFFVFNRMSKVTQELFGHVWTGFWRYLQQVWTFLTNF